MLKISGKNDLNFTKMPINFGMFNLRGIALSISLSVLKKASINPILAHSSADITQVM